MTTVVGYKIKHYADDSARLYAVRRGRWWFSPKRSEYLGTFNTLAEVRAYMLSLVPSDHVLSVDHFDAAGEKCMESWL